MLYAHSKSLLEAGMEAGMIESIKKILSFLDMASYFQKLSFISLSMLIFNGKRHCSSCNQELLISVCIPYIFHEESLMFDPWFFQGKLGKILLWSPRKLLLANIENNIRTNSLPWKTASCVHLPLFSIWILTMYIKKKAVTSLYTLEQWSIYNKFWSSDMEKEMVTYFSRPPCFGMMFDI